MTKAKTIAYWVTTDILVFCMTGGIFELLSVRITTENIWHQAGLSRVHHSAPWARQGARSGRHPLARLPTPQGMGLTYAFFFNMTGAPPTHIANKDGSSIVVVTATIPAALTLASWALRPQSRRLGIIFGPTEADGPTSTTRPARPTLGANP